MPRREPTIHNRALMVTCPRCGCVPGAPCRDTRGSWLKDGKAHRDRTELYREREARRQEREAGR
jgi:hypothetical protein